MKRFLYTVCLLCFLCQGSLASEHNIREECLALNMYHEAVGESVAGQVAVGLVTLNRVASKKWPNDICEVVYQPNQFSWTGNSKKVTDWGRYHKILDLAKQLLYGRIDFDFTQGSTYYHTTKVKPCWLTDVKRVIRIDNHIFYKDTDRSSGVCYNRIGVVK